MKLYSLSIVQATPDGPSTILSTAQDLSSFSFYQRGSVGEFMGFFTKTVVERTAQGGRQSVQENNYTAHVYNRGGAENLAGTTHPIPLFIVQMSFSKAYCDTTHPQLS
jgi:synaptobrevin family protein YKT6